MLTKLPGGSSADEDAADTGSIDEEVKSVAEDMTGEGTGAEYQTKIRTCYRKKPISFGTILCMNFNK